MKVSKLGKNNIARYKNARNTMSSGAGGTNDNNNDDDDDDDNNNNKVRSCFRGPASWHFLVTRMRVELGYLGLCSRQIPAIGVFSLHFCACATQVCFRHFCVGGEGGGVIASTLTAVVSWKTQSFQEDICDPGGALFQVSHKIRTQHNPNGSGFGLPSRGAICCLVSRVWRKYPVRFLPPTGPGKSNHQRIV